MTPEDYILLYEKFQQGLCTPEEEKLLTEYRDNFRLRMADSNTPPFQESENEELRNRIFARIINSTAPKRKTVQIPWKWAAAAVLVLAGSLSVWFLNKQPAKLPETAVRTMPQPGPIEPGSNAATLTLADGSVITLEEASNGILTQKDGSSVSKTGDGLLTYSENGETAPGREAALHTLRIPRGGQYTVTLSDGTRVWMNSESSLTYPAVFNTTERKVIVSGEAYFEVSSNKQKPFIVQTPHTTVQVLGTRFNVNAYQDEKNEKITLLGGSVQLTAGSGKTLLLPGEQGIVDSSRAGIEKKKADINQVMAWKTGYFIFSNNTIQEIMKQVGRWYDMEIVYEGKIPSETFGGMYSRKKDINNLLKSLELTGLVHFKIEGRRIIVMT